MSIPLHFYKKPPIIPLRFYQNRRLSSSFYKIVNNHRKAYYWGKYEIESKMFDRLAYERLRSFIPVRTHAVRPYKTTSTNLLSIKLIQPSN